MIFSFFKSKLNIAIAVVLALVVAFASIQAYKSWNTIARWLGIETEEVLRDKLKDANRSIDKAKDANDSLVIGTTIRDEGKAIETEVREERDTKVAETITKTQVIKKQTEQKVTEIVSSPTLDDKEKVSQVSKVRVESLWRSYCSFQSHPDCVKIEGEKK